MDILRNHISPILNPLLDIITLIALPTIYPIPQSIPLTAINDPMEQNQSRIQRLVTYLASHHGCMRGIQYFTQWRYFPGVFRRLQPRLGGTGGRWGIALRDSSCYFRYSALTSVFGDRSVD